jgi:MFS transporter, Spinster family, sphingosine-1-phosphate transporter
MTPTDPPAAPRGGADPRAARLVALLLAINLLNYLDRYLVAPLLPLLEAAFPGTTKERLGLLAPAFLIVYMVTSPLFGLLGDRVRRFLLVGIGVSLWSLATTGSGLAASFWQLFLFRALVGVGEASFGTAAPSILSDLYPPDRRGRILSLLYVAIPVGSALGYLLGGALGERFGWRTAFFVVGLPGLLLGATALTARDPARGSTEGVDATGLERFLTRGVRARDYLDLVRVPSFVLNNLGMTAYTYVIGGISFWMPTFLHGERGLTLGFASFWLGSITVATGIAGTLLGSLAADRLARRVRGAYFLVSGLSMLAASPFFYLALSSREPVVYWSAFVAAELLLFVNTGPSNTIIVNVTLPSIRTSAVAANILVIHALGDVLSPVVMGAVADRSSLGDAFLATAAVVPLSGLLWLAGTPFLGRDTDRVAARMREVDGGGLGSRRPG